MSRSKSFGVVLSLSIIYILCTSCSDSATQENLPINVSAPAAAAPSDTPAPATAQPATETLLPPPLTPSPTDTPLPLDTATVTSTPMPSNTPTLAASPTPNQVMPGFYDSGGCTSTIYRMGSRYDLCVISVTVTRDRHMIFSVSWSLTDIPDRYTVKKESDQYNFKMYITDNLGNRYNHINGGGVAYKSVIIEDGVPVYGTFEFSTPPVGAFYFDFHDDNKEMVIKNIGLTEPIILYGNLNLSHTSYTLPYLLEDWELTYDELDVPVLVNKDMPTCTLKEQLFGVPQGKLKNHLAIGELTYDIYGYIDQSNNLGVREYVLVEGLDGLDPENLPFFVVTIPLDASEACVFAVSDLLMGVYGGEQ